MPISVTVLTSGGTSTDGAGPHSTASITPSANKLILAAIAYAATVPAAPTTSGNGLTWVAIDSQTYNSGFAGVTLFRAMGATPSAGAMSFDFTGATNNLGASWVIFEAGGVDTSGTNGSGAVVQSAKGSGTDTTLTVTLGAFDALPNATVGVFGWDVNTDANLGVGTGFTEVGRADTGGAENISSFAEYLLGNDTSVDATNSASVAVGGIAIEVKASVAVSNPIIKVSGKSRVIVGGR